MTGPGRRVLIQAGAAVALLAVATSAVLALLVTWWLGVAFLAWTVAALVFVVATRVHSAEDRALRFVGPTRPARAGAGSSAESRLLNLVEGLAPNAGIPRPRCLIIDDAAPNALTLGRDARHGCLIVTTGLLDALSRVELEAIVASGLVRLRSGAAAPSTLAIALTGAGSLLHRAIVRAGSPRPIDLETVALTRYPPGLLSALRIVAAGGPKAPAASSPALGPLWIGPPDDESELARRIAALDEL
jgi:Zn-dependent protease with chaperone function